jgi:hypothetical protein
MPDGTVSVGGTCTVGANGTDNCRRGAACLYDGTCQSFCNVFSDTCRTGFACSRYRGVPFNPDGVGTTGYCTPTCNPITQTRDFDQAPACGSPTVQFPTLGCYGSLGDPFTCMAAGESSRTSDVPASVGANGDAYTNGCAPGYLPVLFASDSDDTIICAAVCEPGPTSLQTPQNAKGRAGSSYNCPARGADGTHECRYWWFLDDPAAPFFPPALGNTLGFCFDYAIWRWDRDGNGTRESTWPSCTTLSNAAHTYDPIWTDDMVWGCAPVP